MEFLIKSFKAKADDAGKISGYFSTYDRIPDSYGDVVEKGAFAETIKKRAESGHPFPLCWNHDLDKIIGKIDEIKDTDKGPLMTASFFDTKLAQEIRQLVQSGVVYQFSFAYEVKESEKPSEEDQKKGIVNILKKLELFEVSIVPIPANPRAEVTEIKSGKRNSRKDADAIKQAISLLQGVLDEADEFENGEDAPKGNPKGKDFDGINPKKEKLLETIKKLNLED